MLSIYVFQIYRCFSVGETGSGAVDTSFVLKTMPVGPVAGLVVS